MPFAAAKYMQMDQCNARVTVRNSGSDVEENFPTTAPWDFSSRAGMAVRSSALRRDAQKELYPKTAL